MPAIRGLTKLVLKVQFSDYTGVPDTAVITILPGTARTLNSSIDSASVSVTGNNLPLGIF